MHIVDLKPDGTRIDIGDGSYDYPLSLDLKITNYCKCLVAIEIIR